MSERFFIDSPITGDHATLQGTEAHHLAHVMRIESGQQVILFDGSGYEFVARVETVGRSKIELTVLERRMVDRESPVRLTLAVALPKGDRQRWLVEKAVELGVMVLVPLSTQRGVAQPTEGALDRLRRSVIEASKQCGRNRLMEIAAAQPWREFAAATPQLGLRLLAHPGCAPLSHVVSPKTALPQLPEIIAAVGPEGGFAEDEVQLAIENHWTTVDLGSRILRIETAALTIAAWAAQLGDTNLQ